MASRHQVKQYLAYWFQLGKNVALNNGKEKMNPNPVFQGHFYSREFEACWQTILSKGTESCHLEGTNESIAELLSSEWEILRCARCPMPIPVRTKGMPPEACPCNDLPLWPNNEIPPPREAISTQNHLESIRNRLIRSNDQNDVLESESSKEPASILAENFNFPLCQCPNINPDEQTHQEIVNAGETRP